MTEANGFTTSSKYFESYSFYQIYRYSAIQINIINSNIIFSIIKVILGAVEGIVCLTPSAQRMWRVASLLKIVPLVLQINQNQHQHHYNVNMQDIVVYSVGMVLTEIKTFFTRNMSDLECNRLAPRPHCGCIYICICACICICVCICVSNCICVCI